MAQLKQREIDRVYTALRPRLQLTRVGGGGGTGTVPPHTHSADTISNTPEGDIASINVQDSLAELAEEKLARSGAQTMLGTLQMNSNDITGVDEMTLTGTAVIHNPLRIDFKSPAETLVRYLDAIEFDLLGEHTTHIEGAYHWDPSLRMLVLDSVNGVQLPMASAYVRVYNAWGLPITAGSSVRVSGFTALEGGLVAVVRVYAADSSQRSNVLGIAAETIADLTSGWVCIKGYVRAPGAFSANGAEYLDGGSPSGLTPVKPDTTRGCLSTIRMGYSTSTDVMIVDIEAVPILQELSDVTSEANRAPLCGDVLVRTLVDDCSVWEPSGLWTEVVLDFGATDAPSDMKVFTIVGDRRVKLSSIITMAPSAKPVAPRQEDEAEFDIFACSCIPTVEQATGNDPLSEFRVYVHSLRGRVVGEYTFNYTVSNPATWNCVAPGGE